MPPLANREQFEREIVADLEPVFEAEYRRAIASPGDIPYGEFEVGLRRSMAKTLARVFQSAGLVLSLGFGLVLSAGAFESTARQWADGYSRELAGQVVQTSRDKAQDAVRTAADDRQRLREGLGLVFLSESRLEGIAITEVTTAVSAGEQGVVIPYNDFLQARNRHADRLIELWQTSHLPNVCEHCRPFEGQPREVWGHLAPLGPPLHVRCNCALRWVRASELARRAA